MNNGLYLAFLRYTLLGSAAVLAFTAHYQYSRAPLGMHDLTRAAAAVPYAASQQLPPLLRAAAARGHNYATQLLAGHVYATRAVPVTHFRIWDGFAAALAVLCLYRVAAMCGTRSAGVLGAFMLASAAPPLWGRHAMVMACALLNFELFLHAVRYDSLARWLAWMLACLLLMWCGVFAELLLLQTWFVGLVLVWLAWHVMSRWLPSDGAVSHSSHRRRRGRAKVRHDEDVSRYVVMLAGVSAIMFLSVAIAVIFFTRFALTPTLLVYIVVWGVGLSLVAGLVLLFLPLYSRERAILIDRLFNSQVVHSVSSPEQLFEPTGQSSLLNMLLAYAGAMVLFIPVLYIVHTHISVFVRLWEGALLLQTMREIGLLRAAVFMSLPVLWAGATAGLYAAGLVSRGRCIGAVCITIMSMMYLLQQRYAAYAAPFYFVAVAGLVSVAVESAAHIVRRGHPVMAAPAVETE